MDCETKSHVKYTSEEYYQYLKTLEVSQFKTFLLNNKLDLHLNSCLIKNCGEKGIDCSDEDSLTNKIKHCFNQPCFKKTWGQNFTQNHKNRCQIDCEINEGIKISDKDFFLNQYDNNIKKFKNFLNPYEDHHVKFSQVNACIANDAEFIEYFKKVGIGKQKFHRKDVDPIINKALDKCFTNEFQTQLKWYEIKSMKCAYNCSLFDPNMKNKILTFGQLFAEGKIKDTDRIFF